MVTHSLVIPALSASSAAEMVHDAARRFVQPPEPDGTEIHLPESVIDLFAADVQLGEHVTHIHPATAPANPAVATDPPLPVEVPTLECHPSADNNVLPIRCECTQRCLTSACSWRGPYKDREKPAD